jgi:2-deoxy-D-gluconate 3-dehydrogenase
MARNPAPAELVGYGRSLGRSVWSTTVDLADPASVDAAASEVLAERQVDILVNNAGTQARAPAVSFPMTDWDTVLQVNLRAVMQLCQAFARPMLERTSGKIINLASLLTFQGGLTVPAYAASKGAIAQLTKALCNEWAGQGVNVNAIAPGYMDTDMNTALLTDPVRSQQIGDRIPAGRWGTPTDIGPAVVFLASPAATYIHGHILTIDGGWMAR